MDEGVVPPPLPPEEYCVVAVMAVEHDCGRGGEPPWANNNQTIDFY
jgi:hypothetical protein